MGGTDDPSNLIELTVEEHAQAHLELYEKYGKREDYIAWKCLSGKIGKEELMFEKSRLGGNISGRTNVEQRRGIFGATEEQRKEWAQKASSKSTTRGSFRDRDFAKECNKKAREAIAVDRLNNPTKYADKAQKAGRKIKETIRKKISEGTYVNTGWLTKERGQEMAQRNNGTSTCPHCGKIGQYRAMKRWHFDNCRELTL